MSVIISTTKGDFTIDLFFEKSPKASRNFLFLCKIKKYNNCLFFNIQKDFIIQTGDPLNNGEGGEDIYSLLNDKSFKGFEQHPSLKHNEIGIVSFVEKKGSQFFITSTKRELKYLDKSKYIFGKIEEGLDVVEKINQAPTEKDTGRPYQAIRIKKTIVIYDPFKQPILGIEKLIPPKSPDHITHFDGMIHEDEDIEGEIKKKRDKGKLEEFLAEKEEKSKAIVLEIAGDVPSFDAKPPDNVLFVCKLNPVTNEKDLEVVFSRFGKVVNCDIIRDKKTKESLGYSFIEFKNSKDCEEAYLGSQNFIIDNKHVKVDFSQSVSKLWKKFFLGKKDGKKIDQKNEESDSSFKRRRNNERYRERDYENERYRERNNERYREKRYEKKDYENRERNNERYREKNYENNRERKNERHRERKKKDYGEEDRYSHKKRKREDYENNRERNERHRERKNERHRERKREDYEEDEEYYHKKKKRRYSPARNRRRSY